MRALSLLAIFALGSLATGAHGMPACVENIALHVCVLCALVVQLLAEKCELRCISVWSVYSL